MEFLLQWLDDVDDFFAAIALLAERLRHVLRAILLLATALCLQMAGMLLAFSRPPLAMALVCLLTVTYLYRGAVGHDCRAGTHGDPGRIA